MMNLQSVQQRWNKSRMVSSLSAAVVARSSLSSAATKETTTRAKQHLLFFEGQTFVTTPRHSIFATRAVSSMSFSAAAAATSQAAVSARTIAEESTSRQRVTTTNTTILQNFIQFFLASMAALFFTSVSSKNTTYSLGLDATAAATTTTTDAATKTTTTSQSSSQQQTPQTHASTPQRHQTTIHPAAREQQQEAERAAAAAAKSKFPTFSFRPAGWKGFKEAFSQHNTSSSTQQDVPLSQAAIELNKQLAEEWSGKPYDVSARAIRGSRFTMEDEFYIGNGGRLAAVFDGHGGGGVSYFLKRHLHNTWSEHLAQKHWEQREDDVPVAAGQAQQQQQQSRVIQIDTLRNNKDTATATATTLQSDQLAAAQNKRQQRPSVSSHVAALRATFDDLENRVLADDNMELMGSTAVAIVIHEGEDGSRTLLSANVGDSRAVLSRNKRAVDLTRDHKPNDEKEKARIMAMGEVLEWDQDCKVHRVRNLSLARAIGDRYAKPAVSSEVEIKQFPVNEEDDEFVVLASDGLWDVMSSQGVVTFVHDYINQELSKLDKEDAASQKIVLRRNIAKLLAREAMRKGSTDNISVLVIWL